MWIGAGRWPQVSGNVFGSDGFSQQPPIYSPSFFPHCFAVIPPEFVGALRNSARTLSPHGDFIGQVRRVLQLIIKSKNVS